MAEQHFISHTALAPLPAADVEGRVIMADFAVFHERPNNNAHFVEPDDGVNSEDYQAGFEAGKAEAAGVYDATIKVMEETLEQLKTTLATKVDEIEKSHARVILQCLEAVLPAVAKQSLLSEMQNVIMQTASQDIQGPLTAQLHPRNETAKSFLTASATPEISIEETDTMSETGVTFSWGVSRVEIDPQSNAKQCLALLSKALPNLPLSEPIEASPNLEPSLSQEGDIA